VILIPKNIEENLNLANWACSILNEELEMFGFDRNGQPLFQTLGFTVKGEIACVVVAYQFVRPNVTMAFAASNPRWATHDNIAMIGKWAFEDLDCERITAFVQKSNKRARKFDEGVGFKYEGKLRRACIDGDVILYGLLREDYEAWLRKAYGKQRLNTG
jgi:hypothetical protein